MLHEFWKVVKWIFFHSSFPFLLIGVSCIEMLNMFQRVEFIHKMQKGLSLFLIIINSLFFVMLLYWMKVPHLKKWIYENTYNIYNINILFSIKWFSNRKCSTIPVWWFVFEVWKMPGAKQLTGTWKSKHDFMKEQKQIKSWI